MPQLFRIGPYIVYFWSNEGIPQEPVHVHIVDGKPTANATKFWITRSGKTILANNNSRIADKQLRLLQRIIEANSENNVDLYSSSSNYQGLTYEDTLIVREEVAPLILPDGDEASAVRFDALMYGIELAYLVGKKYSKARSDLHKKVAGIAGAANIPEIQAQSELENDEL